MSEQFSKAGGAVILLVIIRHHSRWVSISISNPKNCTYCNSVSVMPYWLYFPWSLQALLFFYCNISWYLELIGLDMVYLYIYIHCHTHQTQQSASTLSTNGLKLNVKKHIKTFTYICIIFSESSLCAFFFILQSVHWD